MPIQLNEEDGGKLLVVNVSDKPVTTDYEHFVPEFDRLVRLHGKRRVRFDVSGFHGWKAGALWGDIKFDVKHFADMERLAMVGEKKWQQGMAVFCEPFRRAAIQCFDQTDIAAARKWLSDSQAQNGGISKMNIKQIEVTTMQMVADDKGLLAIERKHRNLRQAIR